MYKCIRSFGEASVSCIWLDVPEVRLSVERLCSVDFMSMLLELMARAGEKLAVAVRS